MSAYDTLRVSEFARILNAAQSNPSAALDLHPVERQLESQLTA